MHPFKWDTLKPTRLWYLTGKKHFRGMLKNQFKTADHDYLPKIRKDAVTLLGLALSSVTGILYSYGKFSPKAKPPEKECTPDNRSALPCPREDPCKDQPDSPLKALFPDKDPSNKK